MKRRRVDETAGHRVDEIGSITKMVTDEQRTLPEDTRVLASFLQSFFETLLRDGCNSNQSEPDELEDGESCVVHEETRCWK